MKKEGNRIKGMDGLRGIAIIGITLFHMFPNVFKGGYLGVVLFFVLTCLVRHTAYADSFC